ncbi:MAG: sodium-dependent transporter [Bacteroidales bacterium]|nr:sodium-dependent transporter [Bacteroidales bacterium]
MAHKEKFSNRWGVITAMAGSAIGLGNIWRFPYIVGEYGGAAFVVLYIVSTIFISLPIFVAEVVLGRKSRMSAAYSMSSLRPGKRVWKFAGYLAVLIPLIICSYYSVIGGWSMDFMLKSFSGFFVRTSTDEVTGLFGNLTDSVWKPVAMHLLFLGVSCFVVMRGVKTGIEKFSRLSMPILFILIIVMICYSVTLPGAEAGIEYLLKPDFSHLTPRSFAYAMGQSFYSLSLGMGIIITYGAYVSKHENILASSAGTAVADFAFAIFAGLAIMPAVFAAGIEPGAGPGLIFQSIPFIFSKMGENLPVISGIVAAFFFIAVVVAAMTSCISLVEVGTSFLSEKYGMSRKKAVLIVYCICGFIGTLCALEGRLFDAFDWFCSNILLLVLSFLVAVFVGFILKKEEVWDNVTNQGQIAVNGKIFPVVYFLIRWVAPIAIAVIFFTNFIL